MISETPGLPFPCLPFPSRVHPTGEVLAFRFIREHTHARAHLLRVVKPALLGWHCLPRMVCIKSICSSQFTCGCCSFLLIFFLLLVVPLAPFPPFACGVHMRLPCVNRRRRVFLNAGSGVANYRFCLDPADQPRYQRRRRLARHALVCRGKVFRL